MLLSPWKIQQPVSFYTLAAWLAVPLIWRALRQCPTLYHGGTVGHEQLHLNRSSTKSVVSYTNLNLLNLFFKQKIKIAFLPIVINLSAIRIDVCILFKTHKENFVLLSLFSVQTSCLLYKYLNVTLVTVHFSKIDLKNMSFTFLSDLIFSRDPWGTIKETLNFEWY